MVPPPPGLFSTMAVALRRACNPVATSRATTSFEPPGVNGTMIRIIRLGKSCASADEIKATAMAHKASNCAMLPHIAARAADASPRAVMFALSDILQQSRASYQGTGPYGCEEAL